MVQCLSLRDINGIKQGCCQDNTSRGKTLTTIEGGKNISQQQYRIWYVKVLFKTFTMTLACSLQIVYKIPMIYFKAVEVATKTYENENYINFKDDLYLRFVVGVDR